MKLLLIEDNPSDARLIVEHLRAAASDQFSAVQAHSLAQGLERVDQEGFDLVLLDLSLPDSEGLATFRQMRERAGRLPIVVLTGFDDTAVAEEAVRLGAQDYLVKGRAHGELLVRSLRYAVQRQQVLDALEEARRQQIEAKNRFLSHVSHELRSPLSVIMQFVSILLDDLAGELNREQRSHLEVVQRNAKQLKAMVDDLLAAARAEGAAFAIETRPLALDELVSDCARAMLPRAQERGLELTVSLPRRLPPVLADPERVCEVLTNLLDNALAFTPQGGRVRVEANDLSEAGREVQVSVVDTGRGISAENLELIFHRFFQEQFPVRGRRGLGLGLFLCHELVTRQGGRIWAESELGKGSTFSFTLPVAPDQGPD